MILILSTAFHFYSILPLLKYYRTSTFHYVHVIILSTLCSILYHAHNESDSISTSMDYSMAFIWFVYDLYIGYTHRILQQIVIGNSIIFIINIQIPYTSYYTLLHSLWHLLSASKCYYIASLYRAQLNTQV
jgi:hypothetical protein